MGWESFHSIWDEPVDPPAGEESKKAKSKKTTSWWEEFHDEDISSYYGDVDKYSYKTAFDDTDESWYRRNSFKYKRYEDYSPSQLFRSSIGFRPTYSSYGDNDAKNKAVRALRTLTRNANTIVDAAKKINYTVQFSRGVDVNTGSMELGNGKNQVVYVSPDVLIETKTAEEEDAVIDALTGFTLLRVQISQSVAPEIISTINAAAPRALVQSMAQNVYDSAKIKEEPATIAKNLAADFVDSYMAGALAKSMLTRLCRRAVVNDWGGFAPYFVRHAKQFSSLGEKLSTAEPSLETYAGKISYNMIADESELPLEPEIAEIVSKHLGNELAHDQILPACVNLIADLRQYLITTTAGPAGELENKLTDRLTDVVQKQQESGSALAEREKATSEQIKKMANFLDKLHDNSRDAGGMFEPVGDACAESETEFTNMRYCEKMLESLEHIANEYKKAADLKLTDAAMNYTDQQLVQNLSHFYQQLNYLQKLGVDQTTIQPDTHKGKHNEERFAAAHAALVKFVNDSREAMREKTQEIKRNLGKRLDADLKELPAWREMLAKLTAEAQQIKQDFAESPVAADLEQTAAALDHGIRALNDKIEEIKISKDLLKKINNSRSASISNLLRNMRALQGQFGGDKMTDLNSVANAIEGSARNASTRNFLRAASTGHIEKNDSLGTSHELPSDHWHDAAIADFVSKKQLTKSTFQAIATRDANSDIFDLLEAQFSDDDKMFPKTLSDLESMGDSAKEQFQNLADSLGMSLSELLKTLRTAEEADESAKYDTTNAKELGAMVREDVLHQLGQLSAVDEELFGQAVPRKSKILDFSAITQVNDEASNAVEEEYVAYINDNANDAKPTTRITRVAKVPYYATIVKGIINANKTAIERIKNALCFQGTKRTGEVHGLVSGDLDEGSLHKLQYDCEHIWSQRQIAKLPDVAVGILVDQSGSMSGQKIKQAREMCVLLAEAIRKIEGMHLHVYGHSANMHNRVDLTMFEHYSSYGPADQADLSGLGAIEAHSNNYDGYAIKEAAKMLARDPAKRKYLFVLSDGLPHGNGYAGDEARKHVTSVCSFVRNRLKIPTYAFAIGVPNSERGHFEEQYDKNKIVFLSEVKKCLPQIVRFLHSTIQKEKNLVSADVD
jgi:hypothetical protein